MKKIKPLILFLILLLSFFLFSCSTNEKTNNNVYSTNLNASVDKTVNLNDLIKELRGEKVSLEDIRLITFRSEISGLDKRIFFEKHLKVLTEILNLNFKICDPDIYYYKNETGIFSQEIRLHFTYLYSEHYFLIVLTLIPNNNLILSINNKEYYCVDEINYNEILEIMNNFYENEINVIQEYYGEK